MCTTKDIRGQVLIDTLNRPLINTQLILDGHLNWYSVNIQSTSWSTTDWQSINCWLIVSQLICIDRHSMACLQKLVNSRLTFDQDVDCVDQVSTEVSMACQWRNRLRISIDTWLQMPLVHMIKLHYNTLVASTMRSSWGLEMFIKRIN